MPPETRVTRDALFRQRFGDSQRALQMADPEQMLHMKKDRRPSRRRGRGQRLDRRRKTGRGDGQIVFLAHLDARRRPHRRAHVGVANQQANGIRKTAGVARFNEQSGFAVGNDAADAAARPATTGRALAWASS